MRCAAAAPAAASCFTGRRLRLAKCAVVVVAAGDSNRGFGGASAAPSKRATVSKSGSSGSEDISAAKQLAETRAALREALDELAAMSAKAEVSKTFLSCFLFFLPLLLARQVLVLLWIQFFLLLV